VTEWSDIPRPAVVGSAADITPGSWLGPAGRTSRTVRSGIPNSNRLRAGVGDQVTDGDAECGGDVFEVVHVEGDLTIEPARHVRLSSTDLFGQLDPADTTSGHPGSDLFGDFQA